MKPARELSLDRLRTVLTALVILHHTAITYGGSGGWFWTEHTPDGSATSLLLTTFLATQQAYFMGFFFLLAGYFTPASLDRKGYGRFLLDRFVRLGLPLVFFILVLAPITVGLGDVGDGKSFWGAVVSLWVHRRVINGPLWFAQALLLFALGYCGWRALRGGPPGQVRDERTPVPAFRWWLLSAVGVGAGALLIRQWVPTGENVFGLQLGYFSSYIFLFALGIAVRRHGWLTALTWRQARPAVICAAIAWPWMPVGMVLASKHVGLAGEARFGGGVQWTAILYAFWEPLVAWGVIAAWLLVARRWLNAPSAVWDWLDRRAYAAYIVHPPVLVGLAVAAHGWGAPALVKFAVVGVAAVVGTWVAAAPLVRVPGVRQVV